MKRLLNIASLVVTAKALWWDKLSPQDRERYVAKAKSFLIVHKETLTEKGKQFVAEKKAVVEEKKIAAERAADDKIASLNAKLEKEKVKENPNPILKDEPPKENDVLDVPTPAYLAAQKSDVVSPGGGN